MIEAGEPIYICEEHGASCHLDCLPQYWRGFERAILRPHGRSGGRVRRISILSYKGKLGGWFIWDSGEMVYPTRAQAARAVWKAHKQAEVKLRAMMPSVSYGWEEEVL